MTVAKPQILQARRVLLTHLNRHPGAHVDDLEPDEVGINGGPAHVRAGTSYHLGKDQLILSKRPYSVYESARDLRGLDNFSSALDVGTFKVTTSRGTFDLRHFSRWLVGLCKAADPDTRDIREVIYSLDGRTVQRWDALRIRSGGDLSHTSHTHVSVHRDADGSCLVRLVYRYLRLIGLLPEENTMATEPERQIDEIHAALFTPQPAVLDGKTLAGGLRDVVYAFVLGKSDNTWLARQFVQQRLLGEAILLAVTANEDTQEIMRRIDQRSLEVVAELEQSETAIRSDIAALVTTAAPQIVAAVHAALLDAIGDVEHEEVKAAVTAAMRELAAQIAVGGTAVQPPADQPPADGGQ